MRIHIIDHMSLITASKITEEGHKNIEKLSNIMREYMEKNNIDPILDFKTLTKEDAKQAMREGKKVTHKYFSPGEWATMENGMVILEDGVRCSSQEFWHWRQQSFFDNDWSLYKE